MNLLPSKHDSIIDALDADALSSLFAFNSYLCGRHFLQRLDPFNLEINSQKIKKKDRHELQIHLHTDINTYIEGIYSATFVTTDNSGNQSEPFVLLIEVSRQELTLGVDELDLDNMMTVAPNPTTGLLNINVDLPENEEISVNVYNAMGQKVTEVVNGNISHGTYQVDLSGNANGFYYVKMAVRGTVITKKVMLNN